MVVDGQGDYVFIDKGVVREKGQYQDSLMTGNWEFYHPDGSISDSGNYQAGKRVQ